MTSVKDHYNRHLGPVYTWLAGGFEAAVERGDAELEAMQLPPPPARAVDLGAGFGMHAIPLARRGYDVTAIDACGPLLEELRRHQAGLPLSIFESDIAAFPEVVPEPVELVLCMGDTLVHLADETTVEKLFATVRQALTPQGRFVITLRDYTEAPDKTLFIPVRSEAHRIFTCGLDYSDSSVTVHDILHEWNGTEWKLAVSTYRKLRLLPAWVRASLERQGFSVELGTAASGMILYMAHPVS